MTLDFKQLDIEAKRAVLKQLLEERIREKVPPRWTFDLSLPDDLVPEGPASSHAYTPRAIVLTGATGFLGSFLLAQLLQQTAATLYCIVRAKDEDHARSRIKAALQKNLLWQEGFADRIQAVAGDISRPLLGLPEETFAFLAQTADTVIHNGFVVNFLMQYNDLRAPNVLGTKEMIRLACAHHMKPLHFVSTFAIYLDAHFRGKVVHEDDIPLPPPSTAGYSLSKIVSEKLLALASERGLATSIYRPPFIGWHSQTGVYNPLDMLIRLIIGCLKLGASPEWNLRFSIAPVDFVSGAISRIALNPSSAGTAFHLLSPRRARNPDVSWKTLLQFLAANGWRLREIPYSEWRLLVRRADNNNPMRDFLPVMPADLSDVDRSYFHQMMDENLPKLFSCANTERALARRLECAPVDEQQIALLLKQVRTAGELS